MRLDIVGCSLVVLSFVHIRRLVLPAMLLLCCCDAVVLEGMKSLATASVLGCVLEPAPHLYFRAWHDSLDDVVSCLDVLCLSYMGFEVHLLRGWFEGTARFLLFAL